MSEGVRPAGSRALTGGCLCGAIRYRLDAPLVEALYCHCLMCRRAHVAPIVAWLTILTHALAMTTGEAVGYRSSALAWRDFCGRCGTPLTWRAVRNPRLVDISIASLDEPAAVAPSRHLWTQSRAAWFETADALPRFATNERPRPVI